MKNSKIITYVFFLGSVIIALISFLIMFADSLHYCNDLYFYERRITSIAQNIQHGEWLASIQSDNMYGAGYLTDVFYPSAMLYPLAFLNLLGVPSSFLVPLMVFLISILTSYTSLRAGKILFRDTNCNYAFLFSFLYVLCWVRVFAVFQTRLISTQIAMALFPLVFCHLVELVENRNWKPLVFSMCFMAYSHLISLLITSVFCCIYIFVYNYKKIKKEPAIIGDFLKAGVVSLVIFSGFLIPLIENITYDKYIFSISKLLNVNIKFPSIEKLIAGFVMHLLIVAVLILLKIKIKDKLLCFSAQITIYLTSFTLTLYPSSLIGYFSPDLQSFLEWRLLLILNFFTSLTICKLISSNSKRQIELGSTILLVNILLAVVLAITPLQMEGMSWKDYDKNGLYVAVCGGEYLNEDYISSNNIDYLQNIAQDKPFGTVKIGENVPDISKVKTDNGDIIEANKSWQSLSFTVDSSHPVSVTTELLYYKNYTATLNEVPIPVVKIDGKVGLSNVSSGNVVIKYQVPTSQRIAAIVSIASVLIFILYYFKNRIFVKKTSS